MAIADSIVVFIVSLLIGALGIYIGARVITGFNNYTYAIITALIGAVVWVVVAALVGWIPLLGPILALIAYILVINYRYPGGWINAFAIALVAWIAALIVLYALGILGIAAFEAIGIPGV